jgi:plastocyanin
MLMRPAKWWKCASVAVLTIGITACGGGSETPAVPATTGGGQAIDLATAGEVKGRVVVDGSLPANPVIRMIADPACLREAPGEQAMESYVVGSDGKSLGNVFVYVKDGLEKYSFQTPTEPVTLDQKGCRYRPHVFGARVGQPINIVNSDPTLHNVHSMGQANREFNRGQPIQGQNDTHTFTAKEVMVPFKCDVHGWMSAYVGVLDHPYFSTTAADGAFDFKSLPPGTYTIEAWHEKLGTSSQSVTIGDKETKEITFTFKASAPAGN